MVLALSLLHSFRHYRCVSVILVSIWALGLRLRVCSIHVLACGAVALLKSDVYIRDIASLEYLRNSTMIPHTVFQVAS